MGYGWATVGLRWGYAEAEAPNPTHSLFANAAPTPHLLSRPHKRCSCARPLLTVAAPTPHGRSCPQDKTRPDTATCALRVCLICAGVRAGVSFIIVAGRVSPSRRRCRATPRTPTATLAKG